MDTTPVQSTAFKGTPEFLQFSATLAMELASGLSSADEIFSRHGYTKVDAANMLANPTFQSMLKEAKATWSADSNAEQRIRAKAKLALEELLHPHYLLARSSDTPPAARIEALKTFERLSGLATTEAAGKNTGERFVVNINLGGDQNERVVIDAPMLVNEEE